jgi:hypothetical protein
MAYSVLRIDPYVIIYDKKKNLPLKPADNKKNLRLKTNNKSTGVAQSANYLKSRTDYTTQCQLVNAKLENDELNPA